MTSFSVAREMSEFVRLGLAADEPPAAVWSMLAAEYPAANLLVRRRAMARGQQLHTATVMTKAETPPFRFTILYPLPPSQSPPKPYLLETVWLVRLNVGGVIHYRHLTVDIPNGTLSGTLLDELNEAAEEMSEDYGADSGPTVTFVLIR